MTSQPHSIQETLKFIKTFPNVGTSEKPLFLAESVITHLGIQDIDPILAQLREDHFGFIEREKYYVMCLTPAGMARVVFIADTPEAKRIQKITLDAIEEAYI